MPSFDEDFEWQQKFRAHFSEIAQRGMRVDVAPAEEDWKRNTDFIMSTVIPLPRREIRISARVRRHEYVRRYADEFTVRLDRPSGMETEMPKLRAGYGDFSIYGFESAPNSDRLQPWFIGNLALLREYVQRGGYYKVERNKDRSSRLAAFHLADMPLGFVLASEGLKTWAGDRVWDQCRRCWWGRDKGGYVTPTDDERQPGSGYGRWCLACGFWWRSGWEMKLAQSIGAALPIRNEKVREGSGRGLHLTYLHVKLRSWVRQAHPRWTAKPSDAHVSACASPRPKSQARCKSSAPRLASSSTDPAWRTSRAARSSGRH